MIYVHLLKAAGNREILTSIRYTVLPRQEVVKRFSIQELSGGLLSKIFLRIFFAKIIYGSSLQRFSAGLLCKGLLPASLQSPSTGFFHKILWLVLCRMPFRGFLKAFQRYVTFSLTGSLDLPDRTMRLSCPKKQSNLAFEGWISAKNW